MHTAMHGKLVVSALLLKMFLLMSFSEKIFTQCLLGTVDIEMNQAAV